MRGPLKVSSKAPWPAAVRFPNPSGGGPLWTDGPSGLQLQSTIGRRCSFLTRTLRLQCSPGPCPGRATSIATPGECSVHYKLPSTAAAGVDVGRAQGGAGQSSRRVQSNLGAQWTLFKLVSTLARSSAPHVVPFPPSFQQSFASKKIDAFAMLFCCYLFRPLFFCFQSSLSSSSPTQYTSCTEGFGERSEVPAPAQKQGALVRGPIKKPKSLTDRGCPAVRVACLDKSQ